MTGGKPADILRQLDVPAANDRELLEEFVRRHEPAAFAELLARYGPVVFGVCRRVTGHRQDAEDAFQAVFLILARKAAEIRNPDALAGWLHRVALRVSQTARRVARRRRGREVEAMTEPAIVPNETLSDIMPILDEELAALPAWYRDAIVMCDLRGLSREAAAATLGVPEGTISSRLASGRKKLAARLIRRGLALSAVALPTSLSAQVPVELSSRTLRLLADYLTGGEIPRSLARLSQGVFAMRRGFVTGLFASVAIAAGVVYAAQPSNRRGEVEPPVSAPAVVGKASAAEPPTRPTDQGAQAIGARPRLRKTVDLARVGTITGLAWNRQGTMVAVGLTTTDRPPFENMCIVYVSTMMPAYFTPPRDTATRTSSLIGFAQDGASVLIEVREPELVSGVHRLQVWGERKHTKDEEKQNNLDSYAVARNIDLDAMSTHGFVFAARGKTFRTVTTEPDAGHPDMTTIEVVELDEISGALLRSLLKTSAPTMTYAQALSPNGKFMAVAQNREVVKVYDIDKGEKISEVTFEPQESKLVQSQWENSAAQSESSSIGMSFSPDGRLLIVSRGIDLTALIDVATGKPAVDLEGFKASKPSATALPGRPSGNPWLRTDSGASFSPDGRLLALVAGEYKMQERAMRAVGGGKLRVEESFTPRGNTIIIWDTKTGKAVKRWNTQYTTTQVAFSPAKPVLAIAEPNGEMTRLGLWDFQAEPPGKK